MKRSKGFNLIEVIIIIVITALVTSIATGVIMINNKTNGINITSSSDDKDLQEFIELYETLVSKYYDNVDKKGMLNAAEEAMVKYLGDKYTTYLQDSEYDEIINELSGTYNGIGVTIEGNKIIDVAKDSPAAKSGLQIGDIITSVNGVNTEGVNAQAIGLLIRGSKSSSASLEILRNEEKMKFEIEKAELVNPSVMYEVLDNTTVGYIAIKNFSQNLKSQVSDALNDLESKNITSLIIDVRYNSGGYLSAAEEVISMFLPQGKVIYSLESNNNTYTYKDETVESRNYPITVLINEGSASASEILAAALKDSYGATLVGTKSYGKGKVQQIIPLTNGDSVKYTSARWLTPAGVCIDGVGISPDYNVEITEEDTNDVQLERAKELLLQ